MQAQQQATVVKDQINTSAVGNQVILKMNDIPQLSTVGKFICININTIGHFILKRFTLIIYRYYYF